ncbi:hypothetical protein [Sphingomonas profundi]|uniref:hypothetical protein n=1 Tax=Alterirhizorhabdus profundi TaxID=2681549 RepID=UPI0012E79156|nr:hypothetical protein [Sphingomonas profundi]
MTSHDLALRRRASATPRTDISAPVEGKADAPGARQILIGGASSVIGRGERKMGSRADTRGSAKPLPVGAHQQARVGQQQGGAQHAP